MFGLAGKIALITCGGSVIGLAAAWRFDERARPTTMAKRMCHRDNLAYWEGEPKQLVLLPQDFV